MAGSAAAATIAWGAACRADEPCARVEASAQLPPLWSAAVQELTRQIAQLPASDCQAMTLSIEPGEAGARVAAVALDGRRTERVVRHPESLVATALGLVMAIPPAPPAPQPSPAETVAPPAAAPVPPALATTGATAQPQDAVPRKSAPGALGLWVGVEAGGRIAQPTSIAMVDVSIDGTVLLEPWLVSVAIRDTPVGLVSPQGLDRDAFRQVAFGLGAGRRMHAGDAAIDVIVEPAVIAMRMEYDFGNGTEARGEDVELSLDALVRLALPVSKGWALTLSLEADAIPGNIGNAPARLDPSAGQSAQPPPFPAFQAALRLGAMGALL